jgi:hypothetical protein
MSLDVYLECKHCHHTVWESNATHNLSPMWRKLGIRDLLYEDQPLAGDLVPKLTAAIADGFDSPRVVHLVEAEDTKS